MSLDAIATQLYTIQTKKNVPLKTAIAMMAREDLAMRFSVYNLARVLTKSTFAATVAQAAFGDRTPLQKKQDEIENKRISQDKKFKQFTALSIATLNRKVNLLATMAERNSTLITGIYSELGAFRLQRRMDARSFSARSVRVPAPSKTIRGQLELINKELQDLKKLGKKPTGGRGVTGKKPKEKKEKVEEPKTLFSQFLPFLLRNPLLLAAVVGGGLRAVGLGSLLLKGYAVYNLPGAVSRMATRMSGKAAYENPITEATSRGVDPYIAGGGTYVALQAMVNAASRFRKRGLKEAEQIPAGEAKKMMTNEARRKIMAKNPNLSFIEAQKQARGSVSRYTKSITHIRKYKVLEPVLRGLAKRFPAVTAASVMYDLSQMSNTISEKSTGMISDGMFKSRMIDHYDDLIDTVGLPGIGMLAGGLLGSALFPGVFTLGGAVLGGTFATFYQMFSRMFGDENGDQKKFATKIFEIIHEDKPHKPREVVRPAEDIQTSKPAGGGAGEIPGSRVSGNQPTRTRDVDMATISQSDPDFMVAVKAVSEKYKLNSEDLLAVMYAESRLDPAAVNPNGGATGLIQFMPSTAESLGTTTGALRMMNRSAQMVYVDKYFESVGLPKTGVDRGTLYSYVFLPGFAKQGRAVLADKNDPKTVKYYDANKGLDIVEPFGQITVADLAAKTSKFKITLPSATPAAQPATPAVATTPNARVETPPTAAAPTVDLINESKKQKEIEDALVTGMGAVNAVAGVKTQLDLVANEAGRRISNLEKLNPIENASVHHNDPTLSAFRMNA